MIHRYAQFWFLEKGLGIVFPPFFVYDFSRKMLLILYSINCPNFIPWLPVLLEILDNMCIATIFFKGRDVINFQTNLIFLIKLFYYYLTKKSRQKLTYLIKWEKNHRLPDCTYTDDSDSINAIILNYIAHSLTGRISSEILSVADLRVDGHNTYQQSQCSPQNNSNSQPEYTRLYLPVSTTLALLPAIRSSICLDPTLWPAWLGKICQKLKLPPV